MDGILVGGRIENGGKGVLRGRRVHIPEFLKRMSHECVS